MANISSNASTDPNKNECIATINEKTFDLWCLAPALVIILILTCLNRRSNFKLEHCNGHPGLLIPINFLGSFKNRFTIAATFGATASTFFTNAKSGLFTIPGPAWVTVFNALIAVLVYGILFYPFFACLTTEYRLVGSLLGFLYVSMRFSLELVIDFQCKSSYEKNEKTYQYIEMLGDVPTYLCLLFIAVRFGVLLFLEVRHKWLKCTSERRYQAVGFVACSVIEKQGIVHVKQLLNPGLTLEVPEEKWYTRLIYRIYKPRADFKFSAQLISTLVVSAIIVFQFLINAVAMLEKYKRTILDYCANDDKCDAVIRLVFGSLQGGYIVAAFFAILILLHFMKCHRDHVLQLYRGRMTFCQDVFVSPARLVGRSLRFSGYQIAYVFTGNVVMGLFMAIIALILGIIFKYARVIFDAETLNGLKELGITMLPTISMAISLWGLQMFLELFVFRDRDLPNNTTITVDNKRLFSIMSYFFFFYNILLGVFSCLVRILKGMFLGVVFLSRIDRTSMMQGFQTWDQAFVAYLGFIHLLVAHSHPVMLVFCQLLINRNKDGNLQESQEQAHPRELHLPRMSHQAINRWFLAVTLLRNPSLIKYRRQGGVRPVVSIYGTMNHNYDSNALL